MRRTLVVFTLAGVFPLLGQAQQRGGGAPAMSGARAAVAPVAAPHMAAAPHALSAPTHAMPAPIRPAAIAHPGVHSGTGRVGTRVAAPSATPKTVHPIGWNHGNGTHHSPVPLDPVFPNGDFADNGFPVPGLGFDYPHFFATHPNAGKCRRCGAGGFVVPFLDGGIYIPTAMYAGEAAAAPAAEETEAAEQPAAAPTDEPAPRETNSNSSMRVRQQAPAPEQAQYVFIKRDGSIIFAVGYSLLNDRLQYVTEEGLRRTIPLSTLDIDATQQFNDQRGVPIKLPA